jgi:hypothetical protein
MNRHSALKPKSKNRCPICGKRTPNRFRCSACWSHLSYDNSYDAYKVHTHTSRSPSTSDYQDPIVNLIEMAKNGTYFIAVNGMGVPWGTGVSGMFNTYNPNKRKNV